MTTPPTKPSPPRVASAATARGVVDAAAPTDAARPALRTFRADSMADALAEVKSTLGPDAMIVGTRVFHSGGVLGLARRTTVEITALPAPSAPATPIATPATAPARAAALAPHSTASSDDPAARAAPALVTSSSTARAPTAPNALPAGPATLATPSPRHPIASRIELRPTDAAAIDSLHAELAAIRRLLAHTMPGSAAARNGTNGQPGPFSSSPRPPATLLAADARHAAVLADLIANGMAPVSAHELLAAAAARLGGPMGHGTTPPSLHDALHDELAARLAEHIAPPAVRSGLDSGGAVRLHAFIGPPGAGKTTLIAKLAAWLRLERRLNVALITCDSFRPAAADHLAAYARALDVPFRAALTPTDLAGAVRAFDACDHVLIDTPGRSARDTERRADLAELLAPLGPGASPDAGRQLHAVLPASLSLASFQAAARACRSLGADRLALTKLDELAEPAALPALLDAAGLPLTWLSLGQRVPDDLAHADPAALADVALAAHPSM